MYDSEAHILKYSIIIHGITELYSSVIPYTTGKKIVPPPQTSNNFLQRRRRLTFQLLYNTNK